MQEQISAAAAEKRKRGRPAIDVSMTSWLNGTHRTHVNTLYMYEGVSIISEAASEIPDHELLWFSDERTQTAGGKQGILEQLGRMRLQDGFEFDQCVFVANLAVNSLKTGRTSREIEKAIRAVRTTIRRQEKAPDDGALQKQAKDAVLDLKIMSIVPKYR